MDREGDRGRHHLTREPRTDPAAVLVALAAAGTLIGCGTRGGWWSDDFQNMSQAQRSSLSWRYLSTPIFGHPLPGTRLVNWVLIRWAPMNYTVAVVVLGAVLALCCVLVHRLATSLAGRRTWASVGLATVTGLSAVWLPPGMWWSAGVQIVTASACVLLVAQAALRCHDATGAVRITGWALWAALWTAVGLAFYERVALTVPAAVVLVLLGRATTVRPGGLLVAARRLLPVVVPLALVIGGYLAVYLHHGYVTQHSQYTTTELVRFIGRSWARALVPGMLGGPFDWYYHNSFYGRSAAPLWWVVTGQLAVAVALAVGLYRAAARTVLAWTVLVVTFVAVQGAVATARLSTYGTAIGDEFRYVADLVPLAVLTLIVTVVAPAQRRTGPGPIGRLSASLVSRFGWVLPVITAAVLVVSAVPVVRTWARNPAPSYLETIRASLTAADRGGPYALWNTLAPRTVVPAGYVPFNTMSNLAQLALGRPVAVDDPDRRMLVADPTGRVVASRFDVEGDYGQVCSTRAGQLVVDTLPAHDGTQRRFLTFGYRGPAGSDVRFALGTARGFVDATGRFTVWRTAGTGRYVVALAGVDARQVRVRFSAPGTCLSQLSFGRPVPR